MPLRRERGLAEHQGSMRSAHNESNALASYRAKHAPTCGRVSTPVVTSCNLDLKLWVGVGTLAGAVLILE